MFKAYSLDLPQYEVVELSRRLILNGMILFIESVQLQLVVGLLVSFSALVMHLSYRPYRARSDNKAATVFHEITFLIMFLGLLVFIERSDTAASSGDTLEIIGLGIIIATFIAIVFAVRQFVVEVSENRPKRRWQQLRKLLAFGTSEFDEVLDKFRSEDDPNKLQGGNRLVSARSMGTMLRTLNEAKTQHETTHRGGSSATLRMLRAGSMKSAGVAPEFGSGSQRYPAAGTVHLTPTVEQSDGSGEEEEEVGVVETADQLGMPSPEKKAVDPRSPHVVH